MSCPKRFCGTIALLAALPSLAAGQTMAAAAPAVIQTHDNLRPAGELRDGVLRLSLWAGVGRWTPDGPSDTLDVAAFGEEGRPLSIPSPLIRVPEGTIVHASVRNTLSEPLRVRGFCDRPGPCEPVLVAPGATRAVRFAMTSAGTFHYWGSTAAPGLGARDGADSQLGGALVADSPGAASPDRLLVMGMRANESDLPGAPAMKVINGRTWPHTERLEYATGEIVRWRVINLTNIAHAMHLHGFYFRVDSVGNGTSDTSYAEPDRRQAVTEQLPSGGTMTMTWTPERAGNWLFHCHMLVHMTAPGELRRGAGNAHASHGAAGASSDTAAGMAGLVLGVHVTGPDRARPSTPGVRRNLQLAIDHDMRHGAAPSYKVGLTAGGLQAPRLNDHTAPGPIMILTRGEPVAVEIVNRLREPTAIHWHGIELESYDDGVPGFGGTVGSVTPAIAPGGTFTARFTPSRAGTFIYHTHWHDPGQLAGGIYGPIIVLEPGDTYRPERDHIVVIGLDGAYTDEPFVNEAFAINGETKPRALVLEPGVSHRLRFINITADAVGLTVQLASRLDPVQWTLIAKDGAATPPSQRTGRPARQLVSVGETYDFEFTPAARGQGALWLELRRANGEQLLQWAVRVR